MFGWNALVYRTSLPSKLFKVHTLELKRIQDLKLFILVILWNPTLVKLWGDPCRRYLCNAESKNFLSLKPAIAVGREITKTKQRIYWCAFQRLTVNIFFQKIQTRNVGHFVGNGGIMVLLVTQTWERTAFSFRVFFPLHWGWSKEKTVWLFSLSKQKYFDVCGQKAKVPILQFTHWYLLLSNLTLVYVLKLFCNSVILNWNHCKQFSYFHDQFCFNDWYFKQKLDGMTGIQNWDHPWLQCLSIKEEFFDECPKAQMVVTWLFFNKARKNQVVKENDDKYFFKRTGFGACGTSIQAVQSEECRGQRTKNEILQIKWVSNIYEWSVEIILSVRVIEW